MATTRAPEIKAFENQVWTSLNSSSPSRVEGLDNNRQTDGANSVQKE